MAADSRRLLVIGQGLAGSVVARAAIATGVVQVHVIDAPYADRPRASQVAGGVYDPIMGQKFTPQPRAMEFIESAEAFYLAEERALGTRFLHRMPAVRAFESRAASDAFHARAADFSRAEIEWSEAGPFSPAIRAEHGGVVTPRAGTLDVPAYLAAVERDLLARGAIERRVLSGEEIVQLASTYDRVVFCTGVSIEELPIAWFQIPWSRTRGETLRIRQSALDRTQILKRGVAFVPRGDHEFRVAGTYENRPMHGEPTQEGKAELLAKIGNALSPEALAAVEFVAHEAGLRPHVQGHSPVVGWSGTQGILNGLGSKGVMWAPRLARWLLEEWTQGGSVIPPEFGLSRFISKTHAGG